MVVNREFFVRGWLPAGLVLNARLLTRAAGPIEGKEYDEYPVLRPVFNADPSQGWSRYQPSPVFPVEQASDTTAIVLKDPIPEGTLVMLPLGEWSGAGTPMVLAINTWYEGRIQLVTGEDIMSVRIYMIPAAQYFSTKGTPTPSDVADIAVTELACKWLPGRGVHTALFQDRGTFTVTREQGFPPTVTVNGETVPCRVMEYYKLTHARVAGLSRGWESTDPNSDRCYITCVVTDWASVGGPQSPIDKFGIVPTPSDVVQSFYTVGYDAIDSVETGKNILDPESESFWAVASGSETGDQVVHYN